MQHRRDASSHAAAGVTAAAIVEAALRLIRAKGVEGLTMRALAAELGVRAPSLYHHIRDKSELLALIARHAFAAFRPNVNAYDRVTSLDDWIAVTRTGALKARTFYRRHPGLAAVILAHATPDRDEGTGSRAALVRAELDALSRLGVPEGQARRVFEAGARWTLASLAAEGSPHSSAARDAQLFRDGLDLVLTGARTSLATAIAQAASEQPEVGR